MALLGVIFYSATAHAAPIQYVYAGEDADLQQDGVVFHLQGKRGEGGKFSAFRSNLQLTCPSGPYAVQLGDYETFGSTVRAERGSPAA